MEKGLEGDCCGLTKVLSQNVPGGTEEDHENLGQDNRCLYRVSNESLQEYESGALPLRQPAG
jgi:hypothetical protein